MIQSWVAWIGRVRGTWWLVLGLLMVLALSVRPLLGFRTVTPGVAPPVTLGLTGWQQLYAKVLGCCVVDGRVDYGALEAHVDVLRRYVAGLAVFGPERTPEAFSSRAQRLAYYINAYNALVLWGVVAHAPITSVQDVGGLLSPVAGFGFFYGLQFELDGHRTNLYDLENDVLRAQFQDARIHAAINCASGGCPDLRDEPYEAERLEAQLEGATRVFCSQPRHVHVDEEARSIQLSAIFDWFHEDFERDARQDGAGDTVLDFIRVHGEPSVVAALAEGVRRGYAVEFIPYDWRLNGAGGGGD